MASVDDLLGRMHRQAAAVRPTGQEPDRQLREHLAGWIPMAATSRRVLESLDPRPGEHPDFYAVLESLTHRRRISAGRPAPDLVALALTVGALGDLLDSYPRDVAAAGQAQRSRLQASVQAALHAAARSTLDLAPEGEYASMLVGKVAEATELAALLPPRARESTLEALTLARLTADTVDGSVQLWLDAADPTFTNYRLLSATALQEAAATLSLLCRITADVLRETARRRIVDLGPGREAAALMEDAAAAWRKASAWPSSVQLVGRAPDHHLAVRWVRDALTGPPLTRLTLRDKVHALQSATTAAAVIARLQATAVVSAVNSGGLWVGHERPNLRPPGVQRRHIKWDWEPMPPDHPAGVLIAARARQAWRAQQAATEAMAETFRPDSLRGGAGGVALVESRIAMGRWETVGIASRAGRPEDEVSSPRVQRPTVAR